MLSILIPTYNYNAYLLALEIENQALKLQIPFEIICRDDGSFSNLNIENQKINSLTNSKFIEAKQNVGRFANRKKLADLAQYDWLLFLDSDVIPKNSHFLLDYVNKTSHDNQAIFGGFAYKQSLYKPNMSLRYKFGKQREEIDATLRNKNPYKVIISANFIIKKNLFLQLNTIKQKNSYGHDYLFGSLLKQHKIKINHINNEVFHLGIDDNNIFLKKTQEAIETLSYLKQENKIDNNAISLLKTYTILSKLKISAIFRGVFEKFQHKMEANLTSTNPNLFIFDIYRLCYFCKINR
jgi:hypothetical protein